MKTRPLGFLSLITAFITLLWAGLFISSTMMAPPVNSLTGQIAAIKGQFNLFILNYANAGLLTLFFTALLAGYYLYCRDENPLWAQVALVLIPVYATCNLVVYLSQIFVVPGLIDLYCHPETTVTAETLLRLALHTWAGSISEFVNGLAYAVMGLVSLILGALLYRKALKLRLGALLFAGGGLLAMIALVGIGIESNALKFLSPLGGFVDLVALILLGLNFLRQPQPESQSVMPRAID